MKTLDQMVQQAKDVLAQVNANTSVDQSIIALVNATNQQMADLRAQLAAAGTDRHKHFQFAYKPW